MYRDGALGASIASIDLSPMSIVSSVTVMYTLLTVVPSLLPLFFSYKVAFYLKKIAP